MPSLQSSNSRRKIDKIFHPALVWVMRFLVGGTFIVSGFTKSVDPWGTFYKIGEYLDVWNWDIPSSLNVLASFGLGTVEFVLGCLVFLGCYRRVAVWMMLLLMAFMLPLTLYIALADPVADCGCFGDFIIISNTATFVKNIVLTLMMIYLSIFNMRVDGLFVPGIQWVIGGITTFYILLIALIGYNVQPLIDFRRFAPGTSLLADNDTSEDNDTPVYEFVYEKDGKKESYHIDNLPDSTWHFVDRRIIEGSERLSDGFVVLQGDEDVTEDVIDDETEEFIVTIPDLRSVDLSFTYLLNELNDYITERGGRMVALVNGNDDDIDWWRDISMASYPIYSADPSMIKELARGNAAIVYLDHGLVKWKRTLFSISYSKLNDQTPGELIDSLDPDPHYYLYAVTLVWVGLVFIIMLLDRSGRLVAWHIRRRGKHKNPMISTAKDAGKSSD